MDQLTIDNISFVKECVLKDLLVKYPWQKASLQYIQSSSYTVCIYIGTANTPGHHMRQANEHIVCID